MYGLRRGTPWGYSLWEFKVYGTPSTSAVKGGAAITHDVNLSGASDQDDDGD
jgi:hypothetical protein